MKNKVYVLDYIDENEFHKLERALKKYNMIAFKKLNFEYYPSLRNGKFVLMEDEAKTEHKSVTLLVGFVWT